jgi:hypothetical protein
MEPSHPEADSPTAGPAEQALSWSALLEGYRTGAKERWSELLIEGLGPWLTRARQRLVAVPPYLDEEDVAQQLVLEVLKGAARWRPQCEDCWIPRKLVEAAERRVRQALSRERSAPTTELDDELQASERAEPELVFDTPIGKASAADLRLLYRVKVLGEPVAALAGEAGITPRRMRRRVWVARERARARTQAGDDKA